MDPVRFLLELAPLAGEEARGAYVAARLPGARRDGLGNVWAGEGRVLLLAHLDTVLPPRPPRRAGERLYAPGVGDNSAGVAVLLSLPEMPGVVRGFTVGEEGLGNLKGARALVEALRPEVVVAVDGYLPGVVDRALGAVRFRARFLGPGGHAWGDRGHPNPVFALAEGLLGLRALLDGGEEASLNASGLRAGEAVNAIPQEAAALLEVRAPDPDRLAALRQAVQAVLAEAARRQGVELALEVVGERPAGCTATPGLLRAAEGALARIGERPLFGPGSTDAGAAVERGIPALGLGVYRGGGAHTEGEWVLPQSLREGREVLLAFLEALGVG
ncbi:M20/M25/M40 family metallo-hydrolase [Thermus thermamylovorans]|uniref:M20/M25/M40 family metallo-hydrolase n=1 Tax=Thermus thermamylovorans TaxID=2509362 RepID=A0A4Q9B4T3_9DEIN|nr:M20/M25/M40 family metallo-hydrolase [Thermus thermamylovorans]TBH20604.1 M20/M25/M40 family metallo-hydrolase [Thermus thermamylovorans]